MIIISSSPKGNPSSSWWSSSSGGDSIGASAPFELFVGRSAPGLTILAATLCLAPPCVPPATKRGDNGGTGGMVLTLTFVVLPVLPASVHWPMDFELPDAFDVAPSDALRSGRSMGSESARVWKRSDGNQSEMLFSLSTPKSSSTKRTASLSCHWPMVSRRASTTDRWPREAKLEAHNRAQW